MKCESTFLKSEVKGKVIIVFLNNAKTGPFGSLLRGEVGYNKSD